MATRHPITDFQISEYPETSKLNMSAFVRNATIPNSARPEPPTVIGRFPIAFAPITAIIESNAPTKYPVPNAIIRNEIPYKIQETIDAINETANVFFAFAVCMLFRLIEHTSLIHLPVLPPLFFFLENFNQKLFNHTRIWNNYLVGANSIMAVMGANAIGNLPITVGGSGLAEFGIVAFLTNADIFNLDVSGYSDIWKSVIGWRVATYYVPIAITWFLLVKLALSKYKDKANTGATSNLSENNMPKH